MPNFEDAYQDAHDSGFLPGLILMAKDRQGVYGAAQDDFNISTT